MKVSKILMMATVMFAVFAAFGFKPKGKFVAPVSIFVGGKCMNVAAGTIESNCSELYSGPQCLATTGDLAYKFEATMTPTCTFPLRKQF